MRMKCSSTKVTVEGVVAVMRPGRMVEVDVAGHRVLAYLSGKLCQSRLKVMPLDRVVVELCEFDLSRGRLVWRLRDDERFVPGEGVRRVRAGADAPGQE